MPANELLAAVMVALSHAGDDVEVAQASLDAVTGTVGASGGIIWLARPDALERVAAAGDEAGVAASVDPDEAWSLFTGSSSDVDVTTVAGGQAAAVALRADGEILGIVGILVPHEGDPAGVPGLARHLPLAAEAIAHGIRRRRSDAATRQALDRSRSLYAVAAHLENTVDHDEIARYVATRTTDLVGATMGVFFYDVTDDGGSSTMRHAVAGAGAEVFDGMSHPRSTRLFEPVFRGRASVRLADVTTDPRFGRNPPHLGFPDGHPRLRSFLAVPVVSRTGEVLGALFFGHEEPDRFTLAHEQLVSRVGRHAAAAIDHARRRQSEHDLADALQRSLLPKELPHVPGVELGVAYRSAGGRADVGGDWYDAVRLDDGRLVLTVGDVVGHNLSAAVAMGNLRVALRVYAFEDAEPATAIERLDRFVQATDATPMATVVMAVYEPGRSRLSLASAGHLPPVLVPAGGRAELLDVKVAPPVGTGLLRPGSVGQSELELGPGDTLLLYTDGLVERRTEVLDVGLARLRAETDAAAGLDVHALAGRLMHRLVDPGERRDDTALLVLRARAAPVAAATA